MHLLHPPAFRFIIAGFLCIIGLSGCQSNQTPDDIRPNFILIFTDELQFSDLGSYGGSIPTPHLDRLAAEGLRFTRAYTPASMCTPSRYAVLTGQFPGRCTSQSFLSGNPTTEPYSIAWNTWLSSNSETLPRVLARNGYFTGMSGKWHVGEAPKGAEIPAFEGSENPADPAVQAKLDSLQAHYENWVRKDGGFDYAASVIWSNFDNHPLKALRFHNFPWITQGAMHFLDVAAGKNQPFFLYLTPTAIHGPNHVADLEQDITLTPDGKQEDLTVYQLALDQLKNSLVDQPSGKQHRYAGISQIDHQLGLIRKKLDELNLAENTFIIFMADHNIEPGKATSYEKGVHIPMITYWPGKSGGSITDALVENVDVLPTVLEIAGIEVSKTIKRDGVSFLPLLTNKEAKTRDFIYAENGYTRSVSDGRYKYIALRYPQSLVKAMEEGTLMHVPSYVKTWPQPHSAIAMAAFPAYFEQDQLYDLGQDPYELQNLAGNASLKAVQDKLTQALREHLSTFQHPFSLEPIPFLQTQQYLQLQAVNRAFDLSEIPWLRRDHGGIEWPPKKQEE